MFLHALASALGGVVGHFNPLLAGILLVAGIFLLRPARGRSAGHTRAAATPRRDRRMPVSLADDEVEPVRQRAVAGARRPSSSSPQAARRRPPRGGGGLFLLLVGGLVGAT